MTLKHHLSIGGCFLFFVYRKNMEQKRATVTWMAIILQRLTPFFCEIFQNNMANNFSDDFEGTKGTTKSQIKNHQEKTELATFQRCFLRLTFKQSSLAFRGIPGRRLLPREIPSGPLRVDPWPMSTKFQSQFFAFARDKRNNTKSNEL